MRGLDTRLNPGVPRDITFDAQAARDAKKARQLDDDEQADDAENELVYLHLGHALMQRSARILRSALFSADSPVNRVTAVVVEDLPESCVTAVSRLVLVGRGGLRLHEEVFLTGIRLRGNAMAEAKVEQVLDAQALTLAGPEIRAALTRLYNADGSRLRTRLLTAMATRAQARQEARTSELDSRREADIRRAHQIFAAFRLNLAESRERLAIEIATQDAMLFTDDQQRQRRRDLRAMEDRLLSLDEEERREIAAIQERFAGIAPHVSAAAVVFALTPADAQSGLVFQ